jgi:asparagine synthase (glutamine-hydrolysing)
MGVLGNYLAPELEGLLDRQEAWDEEYLGALPKDFDDWGWLDKAQLLESETLLGGYLLSSQGDRPAMAHSVEGRFPYLDPDFVALAAGLHWRRRLPVLHEKDSLKGAARGVLPDAILERPKQPYMAPDAPCFFAEGAPDWVGDMLARDRVARYGLFDPEAVGALADKMRRRRSGLIGFRDNMLLVGLLSTQLLVHEFLESPPDRIAAPARGFRRALPLGSRGS